MSQAILTALKALDVSNDNHWTADGLPRLDTVKMLASDQSLTRDSVSAAAPGFTRSNAAEYAPPAVDGGSTPALATQPPAQGDSTVGQGVATEEGAAAPTAAANADSNESAQAEPLQVGGGSGGAADEAQTLAAQLEEAEDETAQLRAAQVQLTKMLNAATAREDALRNKLDAMRPKDDTPNAIQQYLAAQRQRLEERALRQSLIRESGLDLKSLARDLRSPLDSAMSRKSDRGTKRPGS